MVTTWSDVEARRNTKTGNYQDPTEAMLQDPLWNASFNEIRDWDVNVPSEYGGYCACTGNHATAIFLAIQKGENYVAWMRFRKNHDGSVTPQVCDSDAEGAFKVYR